MVVIFLAIGNGTVSVERPVTRPPRHRLVLSQVEVSRRADLASPLLRGLAPGVDSLCSPFGPPVAVVSTSFRLTDTRFRDHSVQ